MLLVIAVLAARAGREGRLSAATNPRLTAITATAGVRPAVLIESSEPVAYIAARPDPFTVLVDLRNVATTGYANGFSVDPGSPVRAVDVEATHGDDGSPVARVRVSLAEPVSHNVRSQRNVIFVELDRTGSVADLPAVTGHGDSAAAAPAYSPSAAVAAMAIPAATVISGVRTSREDGLLSVILEGNGRLAARNVELAGGKRLYLDFAGVRPAVPPVTAFGQAPVERVRVALNSREPLVTRVVIDLDHDVTHRVETVGSDERALKVTFRERTPARAMAAVAMGGSAAGQTRGTPGDERGAKAPPPPEAKAESAQLAEPAAAVGAKADGAKTDGAPKANSGAKATAVAKADTGAQAGPPQETTAPAQGKAYTGHPISLDFQGADLRAVLRTFAEISGLNIVIDPAVQGSVDVSLRDVPWDQALDIILRANKLGYSLDGTIVRVAPLTVLAEEEKQRRQLAEQQALAGELRVMTSTLSYATADQVKPLLVKSALSTRGTIEVDARSNTLIINDLQPALDKAAALIATLDKPQPQVEIEARIVITNKSFKREIGAKLGIGGEMSARLGNPTSLAFPNSVLVGGRTGAVQGGPTSSATNAVNLGVQGATSAVGLALGAINGAFDLDIALTALEQQGKLAVISTPRVSTQNNVEAEITQGTQIPIQVVANNTVTVTFKDAALKLTVTPQITAANTVIMKVNLENAQADFGRSVNGIPPIDTQRANTTVLVGDGQTTVIGGIYFSSQEARESRTPVLHKVPLLGWLFKDDLTNNQNNELLIFITPRIIKG
jgi:type IV pilus assembly protein PilQ